MKSLAFFTLLLFSSLLTTRECAAQYGKYWENVGQIGPNERGATQRVNCGYFWAKDTGIVGTGTNCGYRADNDCGYAKIYYRRGKAWLPAAHPNLDQADARQIVMKDRDTGYIVFEKPFTSATGPTALKTTDGGKTWMPYIAFTGGEATDCLIDQKGNLLYSFASSQSNPPTFFPSGVPGASLAYAGNKLLAIKDDLIQYTYDGGLQWAQEYFTIQPSGEYGNLGGICYSKKFNSLVVVPYYGVGTNGPLVSQDTGASFTYLKDWNGGFKSRWDGTGDVRGGTDAIYVQASVHYSDQSKGFLRTLDGGYHWQNIGGPTSTTETRFFVLGCTGSTVFAFDTSGGIWYTETGGDGTLQREIYNHPKFSGPRSVSALLCGDSLIALPFLNELCADFRIDSIGWITSDVSLDPKLISSGALTLTRPALPQTYSSETGDTIKVVWSPGLLFEHDTSFTRTIYIRYLSGSDQAMHDTTISITLTAKSMAPRIVMNRDAIDFQATSACFPKDTTVTITNTSCDTLTIDKLTGRGAFDLSGIETPLRLAPGESATLTIGFRPVSQGPEFGNVHIDATHQGIQRGFDIPLSGTGTPGEGLLALQSATDVKLPELSICAVGDDTLATLRNTGCAPIIVKNVAITGPADYTLASTISNVTLAPDSAIAFRIAFAPQDKGARNASVTVTWTDISGNNPKDITIALSANVIDGNKVLASSLNQINFGETNICEERDSVFTLTNNGCDTLTITSADVDKNFSVGGNYPIVLAPGESVDVPVTTMVDTAGKPTVLTGTLAITSTADNQIAPIALSRSLYYPTKLLIESVDDASGKQGDVVKFRVVLEGQVPSAMSALHFDFLHNGDLLTWDQYDGIGLNRTNMSGDEQQRSSLTLSPVHDGVIGEFSFKTNLALAEQTTLSFDNIRFDAAGVSFAPECIAVISDSGSRFNYIYTCGDNIIRDRLAGTRLIKSITPNPASNELHLELNATDANISLIDMLGAEVLRSSTDLIDVSKLPAGTYYVRVSTPTDVQTKRVVISR